MDTIAEIRRCHLVENETISSLAVAFARHPLQRQYANVDDTEVPIVLKNRKMSRLKYMQSFA